jgi:ABC-type transport system involved in multi-copper enzyme maturation permease subunit
MVHEYQLAEASDDVLVQEHTDVEIINSWLQILYPELRDTGTYQTMISYVDPVILTDFYDRRDRAVLQYLEQNRPDADKDFLLQMEQGISEPFRYQWATGWGLILNSAISDMGMIMAIFLAIVLSSLFAGEWQNRTSPLMLTARNGWRQIACAKILTGIAFITEIFTLLFAGNLAIQLIYMGTDGWDIPIQTINILAIAPFHMLQAEIYEYTFVFLCAIGYGCIVMCISAFAKNNITALICSLAIIFVPLAIMGNLPLTVQKLLQLIPFVGSGKDIFGTKIYHVMGMQIWSPWVLIIVPIMMGMACLPVAIRRWSRRMKV